jgi:superfamily II DNA/RNA helicase
MTKKFLLNNIPCDFLTSDNAHDREIKQQQLRSGGIKILCVVDIFNEGVDIPEVDTLLFLRPTESLTIFLQQLKLAGMGSKAITLHPGFSLEIYTQVTPRFAPTSATMPFSGMSCTKY